MSVPVLLTPRLRLRAPTLNDYPSALAMWADPEVTRHLGGKPSTREETWARLLRFIGHWHALGFGYWVVEARANHAFAGVVGFGDFHRDMVPVLDGMPEMGWVLNAASHGQGFATEAGRAALAWRDANLPAGDTVCIMDAGHAASFRVAEKLGFEPRTTTTRHGVETLLLARPYPNPAAQ